MTHQGRKSEKFFSWKLQLNAWSKIDFLQSVMQRIEIEFLKAIYDQMHKCNILYYTLKFFGYIQ